MQKAVNFYQVGSTPTPRAMTSNPVLTFDHLNPKTNTRCENPRLVLTHPASGSNTYTCITCGNVVTIPKPESNV